MDIERKVIKRKNKAQVTIFIIIALIIVTAIALIFVIFRKPTVSIAPSENPEAYIKKCIKDATEEAIAILSEHGGDIEPKPSTMFRGKNITYLCYNANYYLPCVNQRPLLIEHIEQEITNYLEPRMQECFLSLRQELEKKNYEVSLGSMNITTELQTKKVSVTIERKLQITRNEETRKFDKFKTSISSPIYELAEVAMEIVNQEAKYCNFDILGYMIFYPDYDLDKFRPGEGDVIYYIRHIQTNKRFVFAVRSCALPPGF